MAAMGRKPPTAESGAQRQLTCAPCTAAGEVDLWLQAWCPRVHRRSRGRRHSPSNATSAAARATLAGEARIQPIRLAHQRRPGERPGGHLEADLALLGGNLGRALG